MGNLHCPTRKTSRAQQVFERAGLVLTPQSVEGSYEALAESNCIPRKWHVEGRWGIPIEQISSGQHQRMRFIPLLDGAESRLPDEIHQLMKAGKASVIYQAPSHSSKAMAWTDWHPGHLAAKSLQIDPKTAAIPYIQGIQGSDSPGSFGSTVSTFTFAELFAGIGGFRVGLEALGGRCVFASEIDSSAREVYLLNFGDDPLVAGDIYEVPDSAIPQVDLLVGGFPCQPFSALGSQPAFDDERGLLFREIVRVLKASDARAFLLENVPGLLGCDDGRTLQAIKDELMLAGYEVQIHTANARNLTAQARKRVFFFGLKENGDGGPNDGDESRSGPSRPGGFQNWRLPFVPSLQLRARDFLQSDEELDENEDIYGLSHEQFKQLRASPKWSRRGGMTHTLVWEDKLCDTLVSHYGTSLAKGNSQLVPRLAPLNPRRFTPRECARLMGFPDSFRLTERKAGENPNIWFRALYKMLGNSVCPPLVAVLASGLLEALGLPPPQGGADDGTWEVYGGSCALRLALEAVALLSGTCSKCAGALSENAKFCAQCGHKQQASLETWALVGLSGRLEDLCRDLRRSVEHEFVLSERQLQAQQGADLEAQRLKYEAEACQQQAKLEAVSAELKECSQKLEAKQKQVKGLLLSSQQTHQRCLHRLAFERSFRAWQACAAQRKEERLQQLVAGKLHTSRLLGQLFGCWRQGTLASSREKWLAHERASFGAVRAKLMEQMELERAQLVAQVEDLTRQLAEEGKQPLWQKFSRT
ncbi:unnamed protein product [Effrenium voratum]|nr:unnamed protein product [Effrenium voratum]